MNESWHKKVIREYKDEVVKSAVIALIAAFAVGIVSFLMGHHFEPQTVNLPEPTLTLRILSGLVFDSLGAILYELGFYYVLSAVMRFFGMSYSDYKAVKRVIWLCLMFVMGYYIVPWVMDVINFVLTVLLNAALLLWFASPFMGVFVLVFLPLCYFFKKYKRDVLDDAPKAHQNG